METRDLSDSHKPRKPGVTRSSKRQKRILLQSPWKECDPADTLISHSGLQNFEKIDKHMHTYIHTFLHKLILF